MKRFPDWEKRLDSFCRSRRNLLFQFGSNDCALFVADAVKEITGDDLAAECRGRYQDRESAASLLRSLCDGDLERYMEQIAKANQMEEIGIKFARRGDIVLLNQPTGPSLGIVSLDGMKALFAVENGPPHLDRTPVLECSRAWRVG